MMLYLYPNKPEEWLDDWKVDSKILNFEEANKDGGRNA